MKKTNIGLLLVIFSFIFGYSYSQTDMREGFHFGLKAGVNMANIYDTEAKNLTADPKYGFAGGVFATIPLGKILAIQPEVMFSQKGYNASGKFLGIPYEISRTTNYLEIPVLLAVRPFKFMSIVAGPQVSFMLSESHKIKSGDFTSEEKEEFKIDNWRKNMIGLHAGLDFYIHHFTISPRVSVDFQDNKGDGTSVDPRYKNLVAQLTVGYAF